MDTILVAVLVLCIVLVVCAYYLGRETARATFMKIAPVTAE